MNEKASEKIRNLMERGKTELNINIVRLKN